MTLGTFSLQVDQDLSITVTEHTMNLSMGSPSLVQSTNESVTGQALTTSVASVIAGLKTPVDVTGISMSASLGSIALVQSCLLYTSPRPRD